VRGRKPTPTALHLLRGNPGKRRRNLREPAPPPVAADLPPPDWLHADAQHEWRRLAPMLGRLGVLTETDVDALAAYCEAWVTWKSATQKLRQFGLVIKTRDGDPPVVSPYVKIAHHAMAQMRSFLVEFGMTPSARARVQVTPASTVPVSKWAGLL
jgi:P27 family predicted phage terminase small subunit